MRRPLVEGACDDGREERPRRGLQLGGGQLAQELAQDDGAQLLREGEGEGEGAGEGDGAGDGEGLWSGCG